MKIAAIPTGGTDTIVVGTDHDAVALEIIDGDEKRVRRILLYPAQAFMLAEGLRQATAWAAARV